MVIIDTSAWIELFRDGEPSVVAKVERALDRRLVAVGDLIYCEILQGIRSERERKTVAALLDGLPKFEMVGFPIAEHSARNCRLLRSRGLTVRKTVDVIIATFCVENGIALLHHDRDFDLMAPHLSLSVL